MKSIILGPDNNLRQRFNPYNPEALNIGQSLRPSHPTRPIFCQLARRYISRAVAGRYLGPPNSGPRALFRGAPGPPPARCSVALNFGPGDGPLRYFFCSMAISRKQRQ